MEMQSTLKTENSALAFVAIPPRTESFDPNRPRLAPGRYPSNIFGKVPKGFDLRKQSIEKLNDWHQKITVHIKALVAVSYPDAELTRAMNINHEIQNASYAFKAKCPSDVATMLQVAVREYESLGASELEEVLNFSNLSHIEKQLSRVTQNPRPVRSSVGADVTLARIKALEAARRDFVKKRNAREALEKKHEKALWEPPVVELSGNDMMFLGCLNEYDRRFERVTQIDRWARQQIKKAEKGPAGGRYFGRNARIKRIRELRPVLKSTLATRIKQVTKSRKAIGYDVATVAFFAARNKYYDAVSRLEAKRPTTLDGAIEMLIYVYNGAFPGSKEPTEIVHPIHLQALVGKAIDALERLPTPAAA